MRAKWVLYCVVSLAVLVGGRSARGDASDEPAGSAAPAPAPSAVTAEPILDAGSGAGSGAGSDAASGSAVTAAPIAAAELANEMDPVDADDGEPPTKLFDEDGDGQVTAEEQADEAEYAHEFAGISETIDTEAVDRELAAREPSKRLLPSIGVEQFRAMVRIVRKVVLHKMEHKMELASERKMTKFAIGVVAFSALGLLLLLMPLGLAKKYPGQGKNLFKYAALAAVTFIVTVNLFGAVLLGMRYVQAQLGTRTNPTLAIASGTFETLDTHAEEYAVMGKELFAPTLEQLRGGEEQPAVVLLANGQKIVKDASVFVDVANMLKKVSFLFELLPVVLMFVTMLLFVLAIRPTLMEIIRLPATAASGRANAGRDVIAGALRRVRGELLATLCTVGVLALLTFLSGAVLGEIVAPAIDSLIYYFSMTVSYLQYVEGASSGLVFATLFAVIFFLVLNLGVLILSMAFFLGKMQKIFQARFTHGVPLSSHVPFIQRAVGAVLLVQLFPWLFVFVASRALAAINESVLENAGDPNAVSWTKALMAGPLALVVGFLVLFWAARGVKAVGYLFRYKVVVPELPADQKN